MTERATRNIDCALCDRTGLVEGHSALCIDRVWTCTSCATMEEWQRGEVQRKESDEAWKALRAREKEKKA